MGRRTLDGHGYATIPTPDGSSSRAVGLADWVDGYILQREIERESDSSRIAARFEQIGRIAARIHNQSSNWRPPPEFERHAFDVPGFVGQSPFWGRFWELPALNAGSARSLPALAMGLKQFLAITVGTQLSTR